MTWHFVSENLVRNTEGCEIRLLDGSWQEPWDLRPIFSESVPTVDRVQHLKEGLTFAKANYAELVA